MCCMKKISAECNFVRNQKESWRFRIILRYAILLAIHLQFFPFSPCDLSFSVIGGWLTASLHGLTNRILFVRSSFFLPFPYIYPLLWLLRFKRYDFAIGPVRVELRIRIQSGRGKGRAQNPPFRHTHTHTHTHTHKVGGGD